MKLGTVIIVHSGAEFLKPSLISIRPFSDFIVLVYANKSNNGHPAPPYLKPLLDDMIKEGLADELVQHHFQSVNTIFQMKNLQRQRRRVGQEICRQRGCTHIIIKDCDEFYEPEQFKMAMRFAEHYDLILCNLYDYAGSVNRRVKKLPPLHVPVIHNIDCELAYVRYKVVVDTERSVAARTIRIFTPEEMMMHHYTAVRYNKEEHLRKFEGHSCFTGKYLAQREGYFKMLEKSQTSDDYETVEDFFNILPYWKSEFAKYVG